jgi:DNA-binding YbaB/EbfC family protein
MTMPSLEEIMKMAQEVQNQMDVAQANLDKIEVEGAAGGGLVKIRTSAKGRIISVDIDESLLKPSEKSMVEDLIAAALNDAKNKADAAAGPELQKMTSGMPLPPGFKLPF